MLSYNTILTLSFFSRYSLVWALREASWSVKANSRFGR
jgi:hypothetical protein